MQRELPKIWGKTDKKSKVIQVYFDGKPYLWHAPYSEKLHAEIFSKFLINSKINYKTRKDFQKRDIPIEKSEEPNYELVGAGVSERVSEKVIKYYGGSGSYFDLYGIKLKHLEDVFKNEKVNIIKENDKNFEPIYLVENLD
ncbi:MAG: hypothetical protein NUV46_03605 [Nanoarchaeota archaeon]|nr:hypothetical protein [Nanoarchaeota archaeon]